MNCALLYLVLKYAVPEYQWGCPGFVDTYFVLR